jgi:hypothetical protein
MKRKTGKSPERTVHRVLSELISVFALLIGPSAKVLSG